MPKLDVDALVKAMLVAAEGALQKQWPKVRTYVTPEFQKIAEALAQIEERRLQGGIDEADARDEVRILRNAAEIVLEGAEGMGKLAVEAAINAALNAVKSVVNKTLGFSLL